MSCTEKRGRIPSVGTISRYVMRASFLTMCIRARALRRESLPVNAFLASTQDPGDWSAAGRTRDAGRPGADAGPARGALKPRSRSAALAPTASRTIFRESQAQYASLACCTSRRIWVYSCTIAQLVRRSPAHEQGVWYYNGEGNPQRLFH